MSNTSIDTPAAAPALLQRLPQLWRWLEPPLNALQPLLALLGRLYVAQAFFLSGLTKLRDWDITLALFQDEYHVPLLPPQLAAWMGTCGELGLPVLLVLGLGGRIAPLGLGVVNLVAVLSLAEIAPAALQQHISWGIVLAVLAVFGTGRWSLDRLLAPAP
ncbi:MAG: DoxX family protein [Rhodoferax sp.]|nr:DoxX family protein [Rhodoferax sp.]